MKIKINILCEVILAIIFASITSSCSSINHPEYWMIQNKKNIIDLNVSQVAIPGSFQANSYNIKGTESICNGTLISYNESSSYTIAKFFEENDITNESAVLIKYLNHQNTNIFNQLSSGIRYLDISICYQNNEFYTSNYFLTDPLTKVAEQINQFTDKYPYELIIIDLDHVWDNNGLIDKKNARLLITQLQNNFGNKIIPNGTTPLTFREIWKNKQSILILSNNPYLYKSDIIWNKNEIVNLNLEPEFATIKKLTNMQAGLSELESANDGKLNIFPVYTKFDLTKNSIDEISYFYFNSDIIIDYLYTLPIINPINIIVADKYFANDVTEYTMNQFKVDNKTFKKPKFQGIKNN